MPFLALTLVFLSFIKTIYYGVFELKEQKNKPGGFTTFFVAILRTYNSYYCYFFILYYIIFNSAYFSGSNSSLYCI